MPLGFQVVQIQPSGNGLADEQGIEGRGPHTGVDIDYTAGAVYVDGQPLDEPYIAGKMRLPLGSAMQGTHWEVPEGSIL